MKKGGGGTVVHKRSSRVVVNKSWSCWEVVCETPPTVIYIKFDTNGPYDV